MFKHSLQMDYSCAMRINVEIDTDLMNEARRVSGLRTKRKAIEEGLRLLIRTHQEGKIRRLRGKLDWNASLVRTWQDH
jgi:Arc/MetJ family transcription regulator